MGSVSHKRLFFPHKSTCFFFVLPPPTKKPKQKPKQKRKRVSRGPLDLARTRAPAKEGKIAPLSERAAGSHLANARRRKGTQVREENYLFRTIGFFHRSFSDFFVPRERAVTFCDLYSATIFYSKNTPGLPVEIKFLNAKKTLTALT